MNDKEKLEKQNEAVDAEIAQLTKVLETSESVEEVKRARTQLDELNVEKRKLSRLREEAIKRDEAAETRRLQKEAKNVEEECRKELKNLISLRDALEACMRQFDILRKRGEALRNANVLVNFPMNPDHIDLWDTRRFLEGCRLASVREAIRE